MGIRSDLSRLLTANTPCRAGFDFSLGPRENDQFTARREERRVWFSPSCGLSHIIAEVAEGVVR